MPALGQVQPLGINDRDAVVGGRAMPSGGLVG